MRQHESCDGCLYDLGGGRDNCMLNVAYECRDGGGFEAWTESGPDDGVARCDDDDAPMPRPAVTLEDLMEEAYGAEDHARERAGDTLN